MKDKSNNKIIPLPFQNIMSELLFSEQMVTFIDLFILFNKSRIFRVLIKI